jgi:tripartite-type tricarboxylate transporter receptor subunit TctC
MSPFLTFVRALSIVLVLLPSTGPVQAQGATDRPLRLVLPFGAGTSTDQLARILAEAITAETRQPVVVENRPGAEGFIGAQAVATAPADGSTVLVSSNSTHVLNLHLYRKLPYDPVKDFVPVRTLGQAALGITVNAESPWRSVQELAAAARREPGRLTFASATAVTRLAGEMFRQAAGVDLLNVPYKSNTLSVNGLIGREIDVIFVDPVQVLQHARPGGRLRLLAVTGPARNTALPEVPTVRESGFPDYVTTFWYGAWVPAGTPAAAVARIDALLGRAMASPAAQAFLRNGGIESLDLSGEAFAAFQATEIARVGRVLKAAGIEPQ